ncbi:MAG: hypothetical protein ACKV2T_17540 [Kofleriaceae bacterium]
MKQLIITCAVAVVGCVTPLETSSTEQHEEVILIEEQIPNCSVLGGNYVAAVEGGRWVCQCIAFCSDPPEPGHDPGGPWGGGGGGGGGGGRGDGESKDDSNDDPSACLSDCQTERNRDKHECIADHAHDLCRYGLSNPDGTDIPAVCKLLPALPVCVQAFVECELGWQFGGHPNTNVSRQWCDLWASNSMNTSCTPKCFAGMEGATCDASVEGQTTIDDGTLDGEGTCWGEKGSNTNCASPDQVSCQYGSDAND